MGSSVIGFVDTSCLFLWMSAVTYPTIHSKVYSTFLIHLADWQIAAGVTMITVQEYRISTELFVSGSLLLGVPLVCKY